MYRLLDKLLEAEKKRVRAEFNRVGSMGFDELNVVNTRKTTQEMYDRFLSDNEKLYLKAAKAAYKKAAKKDGEIDEKWVGVFLGAYSLVTGYLYKSEAERKRMRLNEQILTAREYDNRQMFNESLRKSANLWWTQTMQYGIEAVDEATIEGFKAAGVKRVRWKTQIDGRECEECNERNNKIYKIAEIPAKTHYGCRCYIEPVDD